MPLLKICRAIVLLGLTISCISVQAEKLNKICLTGRVEKSLPTYGKSFLNGAKLALLDAKALQKASIESYLYNNKPMEPVRVYERMINEGCSAIIGYEYLSDLILVTKFQHTNVPILTSYSTTSSHLKLPDNIYMFSPDYDFLANKMVSFLKDNDKDFNQILLITEVNRDSMSQFKAAYIDIFRKEKIPFTEYDFLENDKEISSKVSKFIENHHFKYIFLLSGAIASAKIANKINNNQITFIGTENFGSSVVPSFYIRLKNKKIRAYFIRNLSYLKHKQLLDGFYKRYLERFNAKASILSAYTYDATMLALKALEERGEINNNSILKVNYDGVTGIRVRNNKFFRSNEYTILSVKPNGYINEE